MNIQIKIQTIETNENIKRQSKRPKTPENVWEHTKLVKTQCKHKTQLQIKKLTCLIIFYVISFCLVNLSFLS